MTAIDMATNHRSKRVNPALNSVHTAWLSGNRALLGRVSDSRMVGGRGVDSGAG